MITFFKKKSASGYIRGNQIAEYIGAKVNPLEGYENDVVIFIKGYPFVTKYKSLYMDVMDRGQCIKWLRKNPEWKAIAISKTALQHINEFSKNETVLIPQQHCNFERQIRTRGQVTTVGFCGEYFSFEPFEKEIREKLKSVGLDLDFCHRYWKRHHIIDFYKRIDIQIIWRLNIDHLSMLKNPLKISNAGSFAIPTVSFPEKNFVAEYDGCFLPANSIDEMVGLCEDLKNDSDLYLEMSNKAFLRSQDYHIEKIARLYNELE